MGAARVSGQYLEVLVAGSTAEARLSGQYLEVLVSGASSAAQVSGQYIEVLVRQPGSWRIDDTDFPSAKCYIGGTTGEAVRPIGQPDDVPHILGGNYGSRSFGGGVRPVLKALVHVSCWINGSANNTTQSGKYAFINGLEGTTDSQLAYTTGSAGLTSSALSLIQGHVSQACFIRSGSYEELVMASGPNAYWKFNETSGQFFDSSGNAWHSTGVNGTVNRSQPGIPGSADQAAIFIDGSFGSRVSFSGSALNTTLDFTQEFWLMPTVIRSTGGGVIGKGGTTNSWGGQLDNTGRRFSRKNGGGTDVSVDSAPLVANNWYHVVVTYETATNTLRLYRNGVLMNSAVGLGTENNNGQFYIGSSTDNFWGCYEGYVDEGAVYQRALTADEIQLHYEAGLLANSPITIRRASTACYVTSVSPTTSSTPAFVPGWSSLTSTKRAFIISIIGDISDSQNAFIDGHYVQLGSKAAYIRGLSSGTSLKRAFIISIVGNPSSSRDAFIYGIGKPRVSQPAYMRGLNSGTSSKNAFIISVIATPTVSKNAFLYGIARERFSHAAYIQIETPRVASKPAYIQIETPVTTSKLCTIKASVGLSDNQPAYLRGLQTVRVSRASYIQIETPTTSTKRCFLVGEGVSGGNPAFIFAPWTQPAYIQIETPLSTLKRAYSRGHIISTKQSDVYLRGTASLRVGPQRAFIQVITPVQLQKNSYIVAVEPRTLTKATYIRGIETGRFTRDAFMFGHFRTAPSAISAYIRIGEPSSGSVGAFIQIENPTSVLKNAFVRGLDAANIAPRHCFIDSRYKVTVSQGCFIQIQTPVAVPAKRAFIQIQTVMSAAPKRAYIRNVGNLTQPINAYMLGGYRQSETQLCYIHLPTPVRVAGPRCWIGWKPTITSSVGCFIFETGIDNYTQVCYLNGTHIGEVDNVRKAYINGTWIHSPMTSAGPAAFISGIIRTAVTNKKAFIVNYGLIGDWRFDDGQFDPGAAKANDYSTIDNDGQLVNWPTWVEEPYREDCNHA